VPVLRGLDTQVIEGKLTLSASKADELAEMMATGLTYELDAIIEVRDGKHVLLAVSIRGGEKTLNESGD